jgi:anti-sigma-K factor RskA
VTTPPLLSQAPDHDERYEELAAAQAVGSIEADDRDRLAPHLADCARCQQLLREYVAVVTSLPLSLPEAPPNPALKSRLLAAAESDVLGRESNVEQLASDRPGSTPGPEVRAVPPRRRTVDAGRWIRLSTLAPLAALLMVTFWLGSVNVGLQQEIRAQRAQLEQQQRFIEAVAADDPRVELAGTERAPSARGEVVAPRDGGPPLLVAQGLPELPAGQVYQIWVIADGRPAGAGLLEPGPAMAAPVALARDVSGAEMVALTIEPAGGSSGPTGPIVLAGKV